MQCFPCRHDEDGRCAPLSGPAGSEGQSRMQGNKETKDLRNPQTPEAMATQEPKALTPCTLNHKNTKKTQVQTLLTVTENLEQKSKTI